MIHILENINSPYAVDGFSSVGPWAHGPRTQSTWAHGPIGLGHGPWGSLAHGTRAHGPIGPHGGPVGSKGQPCLDVARCTIKLTLEARALEPQDFSLSLAALGISQDVPVTYMTYTQPRDLEMHVFGRESRF